MYVKSFQTFSQSGQGGTDFELPIRLQEGSEDFSTHYHF